MLEIVFLPFLIIEGIASGIARGLNLSPPPTPFSQLVAGQGQGQREASPLPSLFKGTAISNIEEEEVVRDEEGFIVKRIIRRKVEQE